MSQNLSNTMESGFVSSVLDAEGTSHQISITSLYFELIWGSFYNKKGKKKKVGLKG